MKNKINNILVGLLWLLAVTLGASFWFNIKYGFNLFVGQHWQYLAYMQASGQPVKTSFYISIILFIAIMAFGLYILIQPRMRKIVLPVFDNKQSHEKQPVQQETVIVNKEPAQDVPQSSATTKPVLVRPPRLNVSPITHVSTQKKPTVIQPITNSLSDHDYTDIHNIFKDAGYVVKGSPKIKNVQTSVIAIGTDEVLWIGATGVTTSDMKKTIDTLNNVFLDTLEDIEIHINAFIIGSPDNDESNILKFANIDELRKYINEHKNTPPADEDDMGNFDAYSAYIGTVIDYIRKI